MDVSAGAVWIAEQKISGAHTEKALLVCLEFDAELLRATPPVRKIVQERVRVTGELHVEHLARELPQESGQHGGRRALLADRCPKLLTKIRVFVY